MVFEKKLLRVVISLDPAEGPHYIEPVRNKESDNELDDIYRIVAQRQEWGKTMEDRRILRCYVESCTTDSDEEDERWHNKLNGVTTLQCNMMTKSLYYVRAQDRELPTYDRLTIIDEFLTKFEIAVPEHQRFDALRWALHAMPARWWGTHEGTFKDWCGCKHMMKITSNSIRVLTPSISTIIPYILPKGRTFCWFAIHNRIGDHCSIGLPMHSQVHLGSTLASKPRSRMT